MADAIEAAWRSACAARPDLVLPLEVFRAYVLARTSTPETSCLDDLYLACGCVERREAAAAAFDRELMPFVDAALARWNPSIVAETRQRLFAMFVVDHAGRGPLVATYRGHGALRRWVRVVAAREAGHVWNERPPSTSIDDDELLDVLAPQGDPALSTIKNEATAAFKVAFVASLGELERRERTSLRLHVLDGLTIDEIAPSFGVHRATVARWIANAKQQVMAGTRRRLKKDLRLDSIEVDSLIGLVHSRIDLADEQLLRTR